VQLCKCILTGTSTAKVSFLETSLEIVAHWESYSTELRLILWNLFFFELIVCGAFFYMCCATFEVKLGRIVPVWANCTLCDPSCEDCMFMLLFLFIAVSPHLVGSRDHGDLRMMHTRCSKYTNAFGRSESDKQTEAELLGTKNEIQARFPPF